MTFQPDSVSAAIFDIGGVFTYPDYEPVKAKLIELGLQPPADLQQYRRAHHAGVRALSDADRPTREDHEDFWELYDQAYAALLGVGAESVEEFRIAVRGGWSWVHEENVAAFHRLAATGMPLAIVSNNDGTAPDQMRDYGVCQVGPGPLPTVAAIVDSTIAGVAKPDPAIFTDAIDAFGAAGISPNVIVYVGDTVHADVVGATNAGLQVVQLDPFEQHTHYDHARLHDLDEFVDALTS